MNISSLSLNSVAVYTLLYCFLEETAGQSFIRGDTQIILYGYGLVATCADASEFHRAYSTHKLVAVIFVRAHWNSPQRQELPLTVEITPTDHYSKATRRTRDIHDLKCSSSEKSYCPMLVKQIKSIFFFLCGGTDTNTRTSAKGARCRESESSALSRTAYLDCADVEPRQPRANPAKPEHSP